ncbi:MAG: hypothetical protein ACR2P2_17780 [Nakamurella sp.]
MTSVKGIRDFWMNTLLSGLAYPLVCLTPCGHTTGTAGAPTAGAPSDPSASAISAPTSAGTAIAVESSATASSAVDGDLNICRALPIADVNRITGTHFTKAEPRDVASTVFGCEYTNPAAGDLLQVSVSPTNGKFGYDEIVSADSGRREASPTSRATTTRYCGSPRTRSAPVAPATMSGIHSIGSAVSALVP